MAVLVAHVAAAVPQVRGGVAEIEDDGAGAGEAASADLGGSDSFVVTNDTTIATDNNLCRSQWIADAELA